MLEPLTVFLLIEAYIWKLRFTVPWLWLPILGFIVISHWFRCETARTLGFQTANLGQCLRRFGPGLLVFAVCTVAVGAFAHTIRPLPPVQMLLSFLAYLPWALFQQYLLNAYFWRRFRGNSALVAILFAAVHLPNAFLMAVTLAGGYAATRNYNHFRNLYFLAVVHATVGFVLYIALPDSITHHLDIGPRRPSPTAAQNVPVPNTPKKGLSLLTPETSYVRLSADWQEPCPFPSGNRDGYTT